MATAKRLYGPAQPATSDTSLYDPPAAGSVLTGVLLTNTTGSVATATLAIGTTATAANRLLDGVSVPANDSIFVPMSIPLVDADVVYGKQGTSTALNFTLVGLDLT